MKTKVLFLCTGNSARSQMAEGLLKKLGDDKFEVFSAGLQPTTVNPYAIQVMQERGIDISNQQSKNIAVYAHQKFDYVITLCEKARQSCPFFPGAAQQRHWDLADPAAAQGEEKMITETFRKTRDAIEEKIREFLSKK